MMVKKTAYKKNVVTKKEKIQNDDFGKNRTIMEKNAYLIGLIGLTSCLSRKARVRSL